MRRTTVVKIVVATLALVTIAGPAQADPPPCPPGTHAVQDHSGKRTCVLGWD